MSAEGTPPCQHMGILPKKGWKEAEKHLPRLQGFSCLISIGVGPQPQPSTLEACPPTH